jgi:PAS domain S-box-containing protein
MQDLFRHLPAVIYEYVIYPDGKREFSYMSPASEPILGLSADAVMQDAALMDSIVHPDDLQHLQETSRFSEENALEWNWQGRFQVGGKTKWCEIRSSHELRDNGTILRRGLIQDITIRKESAKESELRYQSLVERLPIGIVIHRNGKLVYANSNAYHILAARRSEDLMGTDVLNFVHPAQRDRVQRRMKEIEAGVPVPMVEQKYLRRDGTLVDVETMSFPFRFRGEQCIQVVFRDITERKQTEARIKKNETLFSQLFENVPMAVVMLDDGGKVHQVNSGFEAMFGYMMDELRGKNLNDFIVPEELRNEGIDLNNLITSHKVVSLETIRRHKNGRLVNVILYGVPVMLENQTINIYGVYVDITDRKKVEEELKIRNAELDNFVYKVSHDLRAPLSSILGLVNLARLPGNTDNPMDYIDIIGGKVEHLDHFIGDVLSHSKNLKMEVTISRVDFQQVIERTFNDLNYLQGASEMSRNIRIDGIDFYSDPWRISEIFRNLVSNAIKYRQMEGVRSEINIKIHVDHMRAEISFSDNGIGIDDANLNKIFEMFYRATEQSDGSGIGLYIVKNAIDKLGGQINVTSRPGHGTRFNIVLPNRINNVITRGVAPLVVEQR